MTRTGPSDVLDDRHLPVLLSTSLLLPAGGSRMAMAARRLPEPTWLSPLACMPPSLRRRRPPAKRRTLRLPPPRLAGGALRRCAATERNGGGAGDGEVHRGLSAPAPSCPTPPPLSLLASTPTANTGLSRRRCAAGHYGRPALTEGHRTASPPTARSALAPARGAVAVAAVKNRG